MPDIKPVVDGDSTFVLGMDSYTLPWKLNPGEFEIGMNLITRGGIAQTRPGSKSLLTVPSGALQGLTFFQPNSGLPQLVFVVGGLVYASVAPFTSYYQIEGLRFSPYSKYIAWATTIQSTDYDPSGVLYYLKKPRNILMIQDGNTRAAYWDGSNGEHLNPTISGQETTIADMDGTPVGLWMVWSNNRLWVSRGSQIFASDIGNPLKFTETQYLNEARSFYLPGPCTGMAETTDRQGIVCFTADTGVFLQSSIQDRSLWLTTPGFQQTILPNIGCVAPRSIVQQYGLLWWYTSKGLINQDDALKINITSRLTVQDNEMFQSKWNMSYDLSSVCGGYFENFIFHAVPNGDVINNRLHVLDQAPFEDLSNSWASYWTGWRPVEFARGIVDGQERVFCLSFDYDGVSRIWEIFREEKTDNGIPITSFLITRQYMFGDRDYKRFKYMEIEMSGIIGATAVSAAVAGTKGAFQKVMEKDISATDGQVYYDSLYGDSAFSFAGSRGQSRIVRSTDTPTSSSCNEECVESDIHGVVDKGFSAMIIWSGIAGISAIRLFSQLYPTPIEGVCEENETDENRLVTADGCGSLSKFSLSVPFDEYRATATFSKYDPVECETVTKTVTQASVISQEDANRKASKTAEWYVFSQIGEE
jgi:hypothetical protein